MCGERGEREREGGRGVEEGRESLLAWIFLCNAFIAASLSDPSTNKLRTSRKSSFYLIIII